MKLSSKTIKLCINGLQLAIAFTVGLSFDTMFGIAPATPTNSNTEVMFWIPFLGMLGALTLLYRLYKARKIEEAK